MVGGERIDDGDYVVTFYVYETCGIFYMRILTFYLSIDSNQPDDGRLQVTVPSGINFHQF